MRLMLENQDEGRIAFTVRREDGFLLRFDVDDNGLHATVASRAFIDTSSEGEGGTIYIAVPFTPPVVPPPPGA